MNRTVWVVIAANVAMVALLVYMAKRRGGDK